MTPHGSPPPTSIMGTCWSMRISSCAVFAVSTRLRRGRGDGTNLPPDPVVPATIDGWTRIPLLAMVAYTLAIWTALTATPCPNESVYLVSPYHFDGRISRPEVWPGRSRPVGDPMPNFLKYRYWMRGLTCCTSWTIPTLLEFARIPATVYLVPFGCVSASWKGKPSTRIWFGIEYALIGVWPPRSRAAATVMVLAVLPGSNTLATGMSVVRSRFCGTAAGLNVGHWAIARILPVDGCMITTEQLSARVSLTRSAHARSASHCSPDWMVSRRFPAGTRGWTLSWVSGICWPAEPVSMRSMPSLPASSVL